MSNQKFTYGLASKEGSLSLVNRDSCSALIWSDVPRFDGQDVGLFMIADGEGTVDSSISASELAIQIVAQEIKFALFQPSDLTISQIMTTAFEKANLQIRAEAAPDTTTLTAGLLIGDHVYIAHVGDSRAYYAYGKYLIQLTDDHRFLQKLIDEGHYTWAQVDAGEVHIANILYRALGMSEDLEVDLLTERLEDDSYLLLSTDGLSVPHRSYVGDMQLLSVLQDNPPQAACKTLIELAQKGGSTDDLSVIILKFTSS